MSFFNPKWRDDLNRAMAKLRITGGGLCDLVSKYEKLAKIGHGTFGEVFKARHRESNEIVALKKVLIENETEGFPTTAIREISILRTLKHENVIKLIEVCLSDDSCQATFYLVFEFCVHDLAGLLSNPRVRFSLGEIKMVIKQLLNGLYYIHAHQILHRDMKSANVLITKNGVLKLADFGLARSCSVSRDDQQKKLTSRVVTLWYRPPELLLGENSYATAVDLWGVGCIMAEMWTRIPIMQGVNEQHQLSLISHLCGSINTETYPGVDKLDLYKTMVLPKNQKRKIKERLRVYIIDNNAVDLLDQLLTLDPAKRVDSDTALYHDFFWTEPLPCALTKMLSPFSHSMFEYLNSRSTIRQNIHAGPGPSNNMAVPTENYEQYQDRVY